MKSGATKKAQVLQKAPFAKIQTPSLRTATTSPAAANDNPQPQGAEQSYDGDEPAVADDATATEPDEQSAEHPELEPANDNQPAVDLPATGTE